MTATESAPAAENGGRVLARDAADGDEFDGDADCLAHAPQAFEPDDRVGLLLRRGVEDRPDGDVINGHPRRRDACSTLCVEKPMTAPSPSSARAASGGMSSCPRCTPSAPTASATSARSLIINFAPRARATLKASSASA